ncbi:hypothetical protein QKU48_gp0323 [Fadolivirus algeromassiliense]|jgi:hypothetical protein|uniref:Uncharacterized protein n=1 Tax=Fadolivirus FV1/VV64 TaxID=3070911 RepID=A0A7D3R0L4_9VIRU|nr:hypothetical protein QKU48_gp0323 [Fadolivirus algeromassiliense]QKF93781.1 hypothetical protein Fadolivirus_1_323 [Fadolivirus FV1/VV64]
MEQNLLLLLNQYDKERDIKKYNILHKLEYYNNYNVDTSFKTKKEKEELAKYIHQNYHKMDDIEMKHVVLKCLDQNKIKQLLLSYELDNYKMKSKKNMTFEEFKNEAVKILLRYQNKAGGFLLEDINWEIYDPGSLEYDVKNNEMLFVNTLDKSDIDDEETYYYLKKIVKKLNMIGENFNVELRQLFEEGDKIAKILLWVTNKNIINDNPEIGL